MKWEEIDYFLSTLDFNDNTKILDIGCGNGRFLGALKNKFPNFSTKNYMGVDLSSSLLEEAKELHPEFSKNFSELNMLNIDSPLLTREGSRGWDYIFFIASFHHLSCYSDRLEVLQKAKTLLLPGGKIYMTNWALNSDLNFEKYKKSIIETKDQTDQRFGSLDYNIKIGEHQRYYHCFSLKELEILALDTSFQVLENRYFDNNRNIITILR